MSQSGDQRESFEQQANTPTLCANGCGFFSNPASNGMCSKCYRDLMAEQERTEKSQELLAGAGSADPGFGAPAAQLAAPALPAAVALASAAPAVAVARAAEATPAAAGEAPGEEDRPVQKNTNRCFSCSKRVGLTGFKCRCGYVFCATHRYAEKHACPFDYKAAGRQSLAKANPLVAASKLEKL